MLGWFCCYQDLIRPIQTGGIDEKWLQGKGIPFKSFYGHLPEIPFHPLLQKARGQVVR
jgi:hypothetical protein